MNKDEMMPIAKFIAEMDKKFIDDNRYNLTKEQKEALKNLLINAMKSLEKVNLKLK